MVYAPATYHLQLRRLLVAGDSPLIGIALRDSGIRSTYHCMAVGFEDTDNNIIPATAERIIKRNDTLWVVGEEHDLQVLRTQIAPKSNKKA